jgi:NADH-quinone oxidoreductase chain G
MIAITINEKKITLEKPVTILEAARSAGIRIPTLCHNDILEPYGGCRLCLVEVEKVPRLLTACTQYITDGMVVRTEADRVIEARRAILEFLLINHPLDCPYCDKAGECDLQDLAMKYGPVAGRFAEGKRRHPENFDDPLIVRNMERCILCSQCVRMCDNVQCASAIAITNRGSKSYMEPFSGGRYNCEYCGNCLTVCPVGAIMSGLHRHDYRSWLIDKEVKTICSYCGVGCSMILQMRGNVVVRSIPRIGLGFNRGLLCNKGRFGNDYIQSAQRLDTPLIRKNGTLQPATWAEALAFTARRLQEIRENSGSESIAGITSGRNTNEDVYVFQKFFRGVLGSNNIDSGASLAYGPAQQFFERIFGQGVTANHIHGISNSDGVVVLGGDPAYVNPVLGLHVRSAHKRGVPVVVVGYADGLKRFSDHQLIPNPLTETILLAALVTEIRNRRPLPGERPLFETLVKDIEGVPLKEVCEISGIEEHELIAAADILSQMTNPSIVVGRNIVQTAQGHLHLFLLAALVYALNGRVYLLSEFPNEQGVLDMGCQPDVLPCGRPLGVEAFRKRCEQMLGIEVPPSPGLRYVEIIEAAHAGSIKALYVMGENLARSLPSANYVKDVLDNIEFLVVQDSFLTETVQAADVVLPAPSWAEKGGTYTNLERRIQVLERAVDERGMEEWKTITEMSKMLGFDMGYRSVADIFAEITRISLLYRDITVEEIKGGKCMWPYKGEPLRHDMHLEGIEPPDMKAFRSVTDARKVYAYRDACLFHSENSSTYSSALKSITPQPYVRVGNALANKLSIGAGDYVRVSTEAGSITLSALIDPCLPGNMVLIPNFENEGIGQIIHWGINPLIKVPVVNGTEVFITKDRIGNESF